MPVSRLARVVRVATTVTVFAGVSALTASSGCSSSGSGFGVGPDGGLITTNPDSSTVVGTDATTAKDAAHMLMPPPGSDASDAKKMTIGEAGFNDAKVMVEASGCVTDAAASTPAPLTHTCIIYSSTGTGDSNNECDGHHDPPSPFPANGSMGNGFDDNCNGLVDEGCSCDNVGSTKPCYLVPASQTENGLPVGWCATNSKGTVACAQQGEGSPTWNGQCRGAQSPYAEDVCAPGDFNCDGKAENPPGGCACKVATITCPTAALTTVPYPPPTALPLEVNAGSWFSDQTQVAQATNWKWSMTGGDCDNILPFPTFGLYATANGSGAPVSTLSTTLGTAMNEHGTVASAPAVTSSVYPAFSLSGDYLLTASWELNGQPYTCSVQIGVRAPGLRAEGCWSTEGAGDDLDLHMAKVNGFTQCTNTHAWSDLACSGVTEDCFYQNCYSSPPEFTDKVKWGFTASAASACTGWGSQSKGTTCGNPRLDRDANGLSGICNKAVSNPNAAAGVGGGFCGPENINLDAPADGDQYEVALRVYTKTAAANALGHVDLYCNGERVLSSGYDPTAVPASNFPQLATGGENTDGDMWKVATVTTSVTGGVLSCTVLPTQSKVANAALDGTTAYCVDDSTANTAGSQEFLTSGGGVPSATVATATCFH